jgi:hypothetical protein
MATAATKPKTEAAAPVIGDARFRAVRRQRNRFNASADREIARFTRAIAASKDPVKIKVNQAKVETWAKAKALLTEV